MPPTPKLLDTARNIRLAEVLRQVDTEYFGATYRDIGIPRKIAIYLEREENRGNYKRRAAEMLRRVINPVHQDAQSVSDDYFFEKTNGKPLAPGFNVFNIEIMPFKKLRHKFSRALNRPSDQLRKKSYKKRKFKEVALRLGISLKNVNGIRRRLKCVERYTNRQYYVKIPYRIIADKICKGVVHENEVFENKKQPKIDYQTHYQQALPVPGIVREKNAARRVKIHKG